MNRPTMFLMSSAVGSVMAVGHFGMAGVEAMIARHMPSISIPALPAHVKVKTPTTAPVPVVTPGAAAKEGSAAKSLAGGVGRVVPLVAGLAAGSKIADEYGDDIGGTMIKQTPGDCYDETPQGNVHRPC